MIKIYDFLILDTNKQATYVWDYGTFLITKGEGKFKINLYRLNDFYVEVFYNRETNDITELKCFKTIEKLSPYLDLIEIEKLK